MSRWTTVGKRSEHRNHRMTHSAPARSAMSPPVCFVHPGRVLELSTTIGVSKMRHIISDYRYHQQVLDYSDGLPSGNRLKSGRLQPLRPHTDPQLTSQACLGVVTVDSRKKRRSPTAPVYRTVYQLNPRGNEGTQHHRRAHSAAAASVSEDIHLISVGLRDYQSLSNGQHNAMVHHSVLPAGDSQQPPVKLQLPSVSSPPPPADQAMKIELSCKTKLPNSQDQQEVKLPDLPIEKDTVTAEPYSQQHAADLMQPKSLTAVPSNQQLVNNTTAQHSGILTSVSHKTTEKSKHNIKRVRYVRSRGNMESRLSKGWTHPVPIEPLQGHVVPCVHIPTGGRASTEQHERVDTPSSVNVDISQILQEP